jgi:hypothetical protein
VNTPALIFRLRWPVLAVLCLLTGAGCVPTSDYEALQKENQELQKSVDRLNVQMRQLQTQLLMSQQQQAQMPEIQARLDQAKKELVEKEEEMRVLQERWEKFKRDRRKALVGRQFSEIALDDGRVLKNAEITGMVDDQLAIRHEGGFIKVALAQGGEEIRWLACFDEQEASDNLRLARLSKAKSIGSQLDAARKQPAGLSGGSSGQLPSSAEEAQALRRAIETQRAALNQAYNRLRAKNQAALRGASWDTARPEESGLINVFAERRAVLGLGELDSLAASIKAGLRKLRDLETVSP